MSETGQVTVVIPCFNSEKTITEAIESCILQGSFLREIIVVDDHSSDNSMATLNKLANKFPQYVKVFSNPNKGANNARSFGFANASGKMIQWLDADDILLEGKFEQQLKVLSESDVDIVYSDSRIDYYDEGTLIRSEDMWTKDHADHLEELLLDNWVPLHSYLMKREVSERLEEINAWNPEQKISQDREYFTLAAIEEFQFKYVPGLFSVYNKKMLDSISSAAFKDRIIYNMNLIKRLMMAIDRSSLKRKSRYLGILNAEIIKSKFYNNRVRFPNLIFPAMASWKRMHWKMKMLLPLLTLYGNVQFIFSKNRGKE